MKKLLFALGIFVFLPVNVAYCADLTLDVNKGTIAGLKMGSRVDERAITSAIGEEPDKVEGGQAEGSSTKHYRYFGLGLSLGSTVQGGKETLSYFVVYLTDAAWPGQDFKRFTGRISPQLSASDDISSARNKLGRPDDEWSSTYGNNAELIYEKSYGSATLNFKDDRLISITFSAEE